MLSQATGTFRVEQLVVTSRTLKEKNLYIQKILVEQTMVEQLSITTSVVNLL